MPAASTVPGVSLAVPALWQPIDLDPSTGVDSARRYVDEAIPGARGAEARALMFGLLRRVIAEAIERGAVFAALYRSSSGAVPCSASLMVAVVETSFLPAAEPGLTPPDGAGCADQVQAGMAGSTERQDLAAGPAVRVHRRQLAATSDAGVEVDEVQWFVFHPTGRYVALLSFSTPNVGLAEPFGFVFDAIAATLSWTS